MNKAWLASLCLALLTATSFSLEAAAATPAAVHPPRPATFRVGVAAVDITPPRSMLPITMAAYGTYRTTPADPNAPYVQPGHPFMARSIAISGADGTMAHTVVLTVLDSQGYFIAYKEDPVTDPGHFGTAGIRAEVQRQTGLDPEHVTVMSTHTHNSPDSVGIWGGGENPNNEAYLQVVRDGAIKSIELALKNRRPAQLYAGWADGRQYMDTVSQVRYDPKTYPLDRMIRVLQARDTAGKVTATFVNYGVHGTVVGEVPMLTPDWPGELAQDLDARWGAGTTVVAPGAVGRTGPSYNDPTPNDSWQGQLAYYASLLVGKVDYALTRMRPVVDGTVTATGQQWVQPITNPIIIPLFYSKTVAPGAVGGTMRSNLPPYALGAAFTTDLNALRVGDLFFGGSPGEAYPEIQSELQARITTPDVCGDPLHVFALTMTNDQVGYTPTLDEYGVALEYTGDEGIFTANPNIGDDNINQQLANARAIGFPTGPNYDPTTEPVAPPPNNDTQAPPYVDQSGPMPDCGPTPPPSLGGHQGSGTSAAPAASATLTLEPPLRAQALAPSPARSLGGEAAMAAHAPASGAPWLVLPGVLGIAYLVGSRRRRQSGRVDR